jgi:alpha/beta superfamily hydrolase
MKRNAASGLFYEAVMKEEKVLFGRDNIRLEGLFADAGGTAGAVISHPHSLMGGDMGNSVVETLAETLFAAGFSTLRFNFRGVGGSTGAFDDGRGEQDDVLEAVSFLEERGFRAILPAGYSFGAWVNAGTLRRRDLLPAIFVSPPIDLFGFDVQALRGRVGLIVCGDRDPYCPAVKIKSVAAELACRLDIIPSADHFFWSQEKELAASVGDFAARLTSQTSHCDGKVTEDRCPAAGPDERER